MSHIIRDMFTFVQIEKGVFRVWQRNFLYFRYKIVSSILWTIFEPTLYLLAFGQGLGQLVKEINGQSYLYFLFPAFLANTGMMVSFFESTYGAFTRLHQQNTFSTILLSPLTPDEIVFGDLLWNMSKGFFGVMGVAIVGGAMNLITSWVFLPVLIVLILICWLFAALGLLITSYARDYDSFVYTTSGLLIPMSLFSGTYFPMEDLPNWIQILSWMFPLTHGVNAIRNILEGKWDLLILINISFIIILGILITNWGCQRIIRKIID